MSRQLSTTRPFRRGYGTGPLAAGVNITLTTGQRPGCGGALSTPWLQPYGKDTAVFAGMDPSDRSTWIRPWNPQPGMIARLNYDGAQTQGDTEMAGLWALPAIYDNLAGDRPRRLRKAWFRRTHRPYNSAGSGRWAG